MLPNSRIEYPYRISILSNRPGYLRRARWLVSFFAMVLAMYFFLQHSWRSLFKAVRGSYCLCRSTTSCSGRAPRGPLVNFRQYLGKLFMQQEKFAKAEEELVWAFSNCPTYAVGIRRNILECLLAVRLRMGKLPPTGLLRKYGSENMAKVVTVAYAAW
eukprot:GHVT01031758.1.p1 GENE.GHVT01031758.1~~GHVT01031758.1.p1  ORF type:complete len:158 (+),score=10.59 GHVT01031758.1:451-924(+)